MRFLATGRILALAVSAVWIGACVAAEEKRTTPDAQPENLLADYNPGFEDKDNALISWSTEGRQVKLIEGTPEDVHSGRRSLRVESAEKAETSSYISNAARIEVRAGEKLAVKVWAKGKGTLPIGLFEYVQEQGKTTQRSVTVMDAVLTDQWKEYSSTFAVSDKAFAVQLLVFIPPAKMYPNLFGADWYVIIDDVSLTRPTKSAETASPEKPTK